MLTALLTVWATSLVVLSVLLATVIAGQTLLSWVRRLLAAWGGRTAPLQRARHGRPRVASEA